LKGGPVKIIDFIFASRPMLLLPVWSIYLVVNYHVASGEYADIDYMIVLTAVTLIVVGGYFLNQVYDKDTDRINNKLGFLQKRMISEREMLSVYLSTSVIGLGLGYFASFRAGLILVIDVLLLLSYSVPPLKLKDRPIGGLLSNAFGYGLLLALIVPGSLRDGNTIRYYLAGYFMLTVSASYLLTIIPDREGDRKAGKRTLAVILTDKLLLAIGSVLLLASSLLAYLCDLPYLAIIGALSATLYLLSLYFSRPGMILFTCKFPILLITLLAGYYYPTYLFFIIVVIVFTRLYYKKRFGIKYPRLN